MGPSGGRSAPWYAAFSPHLQVTVTGAGSGSITAYDGFQAPAGALDGASGGAGWAGGWTAAEGVPQIAAGGLPPPDEFLWTTANHVRLSGSGLAPEARAYRELTAPLGASGATAWFSFVLQADGPSAGTAYGDFAGLFLGDLQVGDVGGHFGLTEVGSAFIEENTTVHVEPGTPAFLAVRIDFADGPDTATLYVNPTPGLDAPNSPAGCRAVKTDLDLGTFDRLFVAGGNQLSMSSFDFRIDEVRVGGSFAEVAPAVVPPPSILVVDTSADAADGEGNVIAFNGESAVVVKDGAAGVPLQRNVIFGNGGPGIDQDDDGASLNDHGDSDTGANGRQNYPLLASASTTGAELNITGILDSVASAAYRIEFFANREADASGYGEGEAYLGFASITTDAAGRADINQTLHVSVSPGTFITATATDPAGNTSDFGPNVIAGDAAFTNQPPTAHGIDDVLALMDGPETVIDLFAAFEDPEDPDGNLVYSLASITNPGLFASTLMDGAAGVLRLAGEDSIGRYEQVLRTISYQNTAPAPDETPRRLTFEADDGLTAGSPVTTWLAINPEPAYGLWVSTDSNVGAPGADGLPAGWREGEILDFGGAHLRFGSLTDGDLSPVVDLDLFTTDPTDPGALHFVAREMSVGAGAHTFDLQIGDLLVSFHQDETIRAPYYETGVQTTVHDQDLMVFRPVAPGDYSTGTFYMLLDDVVPVDLRAVTLVEEPTWVGGTLLPAGTFLLTREAEPQEDILLFTPAGVGAGTTAGSFTTLIDGSDLHIDSSVVRALELIERPTLAGGVTLPGGALLVSLRDDEASVGDNRLPTRRQDIFVLHVTGAGIGSTSANAAPFLDGSDVNLDDNLGTENPYAITLIPSLPLILDLDGDDSIEPGRDFSAGFARGDGPIAIADGDAGFWDLDGATLDSLVATLTNLPDGASEALAAHTSGTSITAAYDAGTGVLTLSGNAPLAHYQQVLRTVTYDNTAASPDTTTRVITFVGHDGRHPAKPARCRVVYAPTHTVIPVAGANGSISPPAAVTVNAGESARFVVTADAHHHIADVRTNGVSVGVFTQADTVYTQVFSNILTDQMIEAAFAIDQFLVATDPGDHGQITPANPTVGYGDAIDLIITADPDYHIAEVLVDGVSVGVMGPGITVATQTLTQVTADRQVEARFAADTGSIRVWIDPAGAVTGGAQWRMLDGPDSSWHPSGDSIGGLPVGSYTLDFSHAAGFVTPAPAGVTIRAGEQSYHQTYALPVSVLIPGGTFAMGNIGGVGGRAIRVDPFLMKPGEVTVAEYQAYVLAVGDDMPPQPASGWERPVVNISWDDAVGFLNWRSDEAGLTRAYAGHEGAWVLSVTEEDSDDDGMPDWWEHHYYQHPTKTAPDEDADGDGSSNRDEFHAGTHPTDATSVIRIVDIFSYEGAMVVVWPSVAGKRYALDVIDETTGAWAPVATAIPADPPYNTFADEGNPLPRCFYRVRVE